MTAGDVRAGTWAPCGPPFSSYEASDGLWSDGMVVAEGRGQVRSIDRMLPDGRRRKGAVLTQRRSPRGYWQVNVTDDDGRKRTVEVHTLMMLAHEGPCPAGMQVRHWDDDPDSNVWAPGGEAAILAGGPGRLIYGTPKQNAADKFRNNGWERRPERVPRFCACGEPVTKGSATRCLECVKQTGVDAAALLRDGLSAVDAAQKLTYSSPEGLVKLAVRYGGWDPSRAVTSGRRSRGVMATVSRWLRRGDRA